MINRWFTGTLGKLAGIAYTLGTACLIASLALAGSPGAGLAAPLEAGEKVKVCHAAGREGTTQFVTLEVPTNSGGFPQGHFTEDGTPLAGHEADYLGACEEEPTPDTPTPDTPTPDTPTPDTPTPDTPTPDTPTPDTPTPDTPTPDTPTPDTPTPDTPTPDTPTPDTPTPDTPTPDTPTPDTPTPDTPTPETPTPGSPNIVDPKEDSLIQDNDGNSVPSPGDVLQYTMTISNTGDEAAEGVVFNDTPDSNTTLMSGSVTTSQGTVVTGNNGGDTSVQVNIGTINPNDTVTITFNVTINAGVSTNVNSVSNQGVVTGNNFPDNPTDDPDTGDPNDPTDTPIVHPTPEPTDPPSDPDDPTPEPTDPPSDPDDPTSEPQPTSVATTTTVLIPVTGVDRSLAVSAGVANVAGSLQNLGLGLLGLGLVLQGMASRRKRENE